CRRRGRSRRSRRCGSPARARPRSPPRPESGCGRPMPRAIVDSTSEQDEGGMGSATTPPMTAGQERAARAWVALLLAHTALTRSFNADLQAQHGLTVTDFEVLRHLSGADGRRMRRVDLAQRVGLTPSGITRLLDGLERGGLVRKASCTSDARVTYA